MQFNSAFSPETAFQKESPPGNVLYLPENSFSFPGLPNLGFYALRAKRGCFLLGRRGGIGRRRGFKIPR